MKDYNEMAESVLQRAKIRATRQKKQRHIVIGLVTATLSLAILFTTVGMGKNRNPADGTTPTISTNNHTSYEPTQQVYLLAVTEDGADLTLMQANVTLPMKSMLRVRSLKRLTKSEIEKAVYEEKVFRDAFEAKYKNSDGSIFEWLRSEDAIIQYLSGGKHSLILPDASQIESVVRETTGVLDIGESWGVYNEDVIIGEGENAVIIPKGSYRIFLEIRMGLDTQRYFENHPDTPLSTINDIITLTINYKNGTTEILRFNVAVDDEGDIYITQYGENKSV
ncbi:MAG: hypothetical protein IKC95_02260 [Oscillospiraceae bacterium]|nr:hypothetical protein [Oscillospiraceae bacterium]